MKQLIRQFLIFGIALFVLCAFAPSNSFAGVNVFAEGAYTATDLVVYIYADINGGTVLRSAGVKLTYPAAGLNVTSAEKNETAWFLGSEAYMDPDTGTAGEVIFILGKLDTAAPAEGVSGTRVLLGKVTFDRTDSTMPYAPVLSMVLGKSGDFANFVDTATPAVVMDGSVTFGTMTVKERGDANGDGNITAVDYVAIRNNLSATDFPPYMDCNNDGSISAVDYVCVRNKL